MPQPYTYGTSRFWEMFPGLLVWGTFIFAIGLSFLQPLWVIVFILIFDLLWLYRVLYFNLFVVLSWKRYRDAQRIDWRQKINALPSSQRIHHLVFLPTYKEDYAIIRETLRSLKDTSFPTDRIMVVLGGEQADEDAFGKYARKAQQEFGSLFEELIVTVHPKGLPEEIPGKGSNLNWMGREVEKFLQQAHPHLKDEDLIVSAFDIDTIAHQQYFSYLTFLYCTVEQPTRTSFQPIALFSNNIWNASAPVRIAAFGTTFWLFGELTRPDRLWTFSSHSMPWKMLRDVGFWQKDIVSEDSRIFMQAFLHYHGDYRVTPMFLPVSMDTVTGKTYGESLRGLYVQMRRWAWGVEHLPYLVHGFKQDKQIPRLKKFRYFFNHVEGMYTWATAPITMFVLGWLPLTVAKGETNALIQAAPFTLEQIMQWAMVGIFISAVMSLTILPRRPQDVRKHTWIIMLAQWLLLPVTFIVFGSFPAIDAQTRLMLGKYLGFHVTKKGR
jgi:cellulose synthase/poly-beta-1,6-N-acetylglucosamine synthase-like glycosyltransferase